MFAAEMRFPKGFPKGVFRGKHIDEHIVKHIDEQRRGDEHIHAASATDPQVVIATRAVRRLSLVLLALLFSSRMRVDQTARSDRLWLRGDGKRARAKGIYSA